MHQKNSKHLQSKSDLFDVKSNGMLYSSVPLTVSNTLLLGSFIDSSGYILKHNTLHAHYESHKNLKLFIGSIIS